MNILSGLITNYPDSNLLYHYTKTSTFFEKIAPKKAIRLSSFKDTNDPFEFDRIRHYVMGGAIKEELDRMFIKGREINKIRQNIKVCCFSIDNPDNQYEEDINFCRGFSRSRMWSQYAESHCGLCLVFDKKKLLSSFKNQNKYFKDCNVNKYAKNIVYDNDLLGFFALSNLKEITQAESAYEFVSNNIDKYAFTKLKDYRDEQEYRFIVVPENIIENDVYIEYSKSLVGIILGYKFPDVYKINIKKYSEENDCILYSMSWINGKPAINEEPF